MNSQSLFGNMPIWRALQGLGVDMGCNGERNTFTDSRIPGAAFQIVKGGIIETTDTELFVAGNIVDYVATVLGSYDAAVDHLLHVHGDHLVTAGDLPPITRRDELVQQSAAARHRFLAFRKLRNNLLHDSLLCQAREWLTSKRLNAAALRDYVYAGFGSQLNELLPSTFSDRDVYVLFCYMLNPWTYGAFESFNVRSGKKDFIHIQSSSLLFFGLTSCEDGRAWMHDTTEAAAVALSNRTKTAVGYGHIVVLPTGDGDVNDFRLSYARCGPELSLVRMCQSLKCFDQLEIVKDGRVYDLYAHAIDQVQRALNAGGLSKFPDVLAALRQDPELSAMIEQILSNMGRTALLDKVKREMDFYRSYKFKSLSISETPNGYLARKGADTSRFTNFTIRIDHTLSFPESGDLYYAGRLLFSNRAYPISIPRRMLLKPRDVESLAQLTVTKIGKATNLPIITDTTYQACLGNVLSQQASGVPYHVGVEHLGWSASKSIYVTPTWMVDAHGVKETSRFCHPGRSQFLTFCDFNPQKLDPKPAELHASVWTAICMVTAMIARDFIGATVGAFDITNSEDNVDILLAVLAGLGQKTPFPINTNVRHKKLSSFDHMSGFPVVVNCPVKEVAAFIQQPAFRLVEDGFEFSRTPAVATNKDLITVTARKVFQACIMGLVRTGGLRHVINAELMTPSRLVQEGRALVKRFTDYQNFSVIFDRMPTLTDFVSTITEDDLSGYFWFDLEQQAAVINCRRAKLKRGDMLTELVAAGLEPRNEGCHNLLVDGEALIKFLSDFFGHEIHLTSKQTEDQDTVKVIADGVSNISQKSIPESTPSPATAESV